MNCGRGMMLKVLLFNAHLQKCLQCLDMLFQRCSVRVGGAYSVCYNKVRYTVIILSQPCLVGVPRGRHFYPNLIPTPRHNMRLFFRSYLLSKNPLSGAKCF